MDNNTSFMGNIDPQQILENLKTLNDTLKESQERVRQYAATFGLLKQETEQFADVLPKLNWTKNFFKQMLPSEDIDNIGRSLNELEKYKIKSLSIIEKRDQILNKKESSGIDKQLAYVTAEEETQALNIATLKKTEIWTNLFASIDKLSKKSIKSQINDIDSLIKYIKTNQTEGGIPPGFSEDDVVRINKIAEGYAAGTDAARNFVKETEASSAGFKKTLNEIISKNSILKIIDGFNKLGQAAAGSKEEIEAVEKILDGFKGVGTAFTEAGKAMEGMGIKAGEAVVNIGNMISQTASMAGTGASVGGLWGGIIGGIVGLASSMAPLLTTTRELSTATKHYYETLLKVYDGLIEKQISLIKSSSGENTTKATQDAEKFAKHKQKTETDYLEKHLKTKSGKTINDKVFQFLAKNDLEGYRSAVDEYIETNGKKHYIDIFAEKIKSREIKLKETAFFDPEALFAAGIDVGGLITNSKEVLPSLSADQINVLKTKAPEIWAKFDEETQKRLDGVVAADEIIKKINTAKNESNTGTTFDDLSKKLMDLVKQADLTFEDISKSFEGHMNTAILNMVKKKHLTEKLNEWYENFSQKMDNDELNPGEIEELRAQYKDIVENANNEYKKAMEIAGIDIPPPSTGNGAQTRSASAQGIATMSQESASELNGNFYALIYLVDEIRHLLLQRFGISENLGGMMQQNRDQSLVILQDLLHVNQTVAEKLLPAIINLLTLSEKTPEPHKKGLPDLPVFDIQMSESMKESIKKQLDSKGLLLQSIDTRSGEWSALDTIQEAIEASRMHLQPALGQRFSPLHGMNPTDSPVQSVFPSMNELLDVSRISNMYLLDIRNSTSHLLAIDANIGTMNQNILALRNEGIRMRS